VNNVLSFIIQTKKNKLLSWRNVPVIKEFIALIPFATINLNEMAI